MKFKNRKLEIGEDGETSTQSIVSLSMPAADFIIYAPPLQSSTTSTASSSSSSRSRSSQRHPSPGFESSMALTIIILLAALFFMGFFSVYLRCVAAAAAASSSGRWRWRWRRRRSRTAANFISNSRLQQLVAAAAASSSDINNINPSKDDDQGLDPTIIRSLPILPYHNYIMSSSSSTNDGIRIGGINDIKNRDDEDRVVVSLVDDDDDDDKDDCVVCLCEYKEGEMVKVIPNCGHLFHPECIDLWFISHSSCPLCRSTQLFPPSPDQHKQLEQEEEDDELMKSTVVVLRRAYSFNGGNCSSDYSSSSSLLLGGGGGGGGGGDNIERLVMLKRSSSWSCSTHASKLIN